MAIIRFWCANFPRRSEAVKVKPYGLPEKILKGTNFFRQTLTALHGFTGRGLTKTLKQLHSCTSGRVKYLASSQR